MTEIRDLRVSMVIAAAAVVAALVAAAVGGSVRWVTRRNVVLSVDWISDADPIADCLRSQ